MPDRGDDNKKKRDKSSDFEVVDPSRMSEKEWSEALEEWDETLAGLQQTDKTAASGERQESVEGNDGAEDGESPQAAPLGPGAGLGDGAEDSDALDLPDVDETLDDLLRDSQSLSPLLDGQDSGGHVPSSSSEEATRIASIEDILAQAGPLAGEGEERGDESRDKEPFSEEATRIAGPELGTMLAASLREESEEEADLEPDDFYDDIVVATADDEDDDETAEGADASEQDAELVWSSDEAVADKIGALDNILSEDVEDAVEELSAVAPGTFGEELVDGAALVPTAVVGSQDDSEVGTGTALETAEDALSQEGDGETADTERQDGQRPPEEMTAEGGDVEVAGKASEKVEEGEEFEDGAHLDQEVERDESRHDAEGDESTHDVETAMEGDDSELDSSLQSAGRQLAARDDQIGDSAGMDSSLGSLTDMEDVVGGGAAQEDGLGILDELVAGGEPGWLEDDLQSDLTGRQSMDPMLAAVLSVGYMLGEFSEAHELDEAQDRSFEPDAEVGVFERETRKFETPRIDGTKVEDGVDDAWLLGLAQDLDRDAAACQDEETMARRTIAAGFVYDAGLGQAEQALGRFLDGISRSAACVECLWSAAGDAFRVGDWDTLTRIHEQAAEFLTGADAVVMGAVAAELAFYMGDEDRGRATLLNLSADKAARAWSLLAAHDSAVAAGQFQDAARQLVRLGSESPSEQDAGELMLIGGDLLRGSSAFDEAVEAYDKALQAEGDETVRILAHRGKLWCSAAGERWADMVDELGSLADVVGDDLAAGLRKRQVEISWRKLHDTQKTLVVLASLTEEAKNELVDIEAEALLSQGRHDEAAEAYRRAASAVEDPLRRAELLLVGGRVAESSLGTQGLSVELYRQALSECRDASAAELGLWRRLVASEADRSPGRELLRWAANLSGMRKDVILSWLAREHRLAGESEEAEAVLAEAAALEGGPGLYVLLEAALGGGDIGGKAGAGRSSETDEALRLWLAAFVDPSLDRLAQLASRDPWPCAWPLRHAWVRGEKSEDGGDPVEETGALYGSLVDRIGGDVAGWFLVRRMVETPVEDRASWATWPGAFLHVLHLGGDHGAQESPWAALVEQTQDDVTRVVASWLDAAWLELFADERARVLEGYARAAELEFGPMRGLDRVMLSEGLLDRVESNRARRNPAGPDPVRYALSALSGRLEQAAREAKALAGKDETGVWQFEWESLQQDLGAWPTLASEAISRVQKADEAGDPKTKIRAYEQLVWVDRDGRGEESSAMLGYASLLQLDPSNQRARRALELYYAADSRFDDLASVYEMGSRAEDVPPVELAAMLARLFMLRRRLGQTQEAEEIARRLVELDPTRTAAALFLESRARVEGDLDLFARVWGSLADQLDAHPVSRGAAFCRAGQARLDQDLVEDARALFAAAVGADPPTVIPAVSWLRLGLQKEQWEDVANAAEALARAASGVDVRADALLLAGVVCEDHLGDDERAEFFYKDCLGVRPGDFDAYSRLADLLRRKQDFERLAEVIEERLAVEDAPVVKVDLLWELAKLWRDRLGSPARAIEFLDALLALKPDYQAALNAVAELYEAEGRFEDVAEILSRMCRLERDPEVLQGLLYRLGAVLEEQLGDKRRAAAVFSQAVAVNPNHIEALERLAAIHEHLGEWKAALSVSGRILKVVSDSARQVREYVRLARILEHGYKDMRRAQEALRRAVAAAPEDLTAIGELASFYARRGDMSSLLVHLDQAASVMREGLARDALDVERYRGLVQIFKWRRSGDRAARAAEILDLFGLAGPDELALLTEHPVRPVATKSLVGAEVDDVLFGESLPSSLRQIFRILGPGLAKQYSGGLREYGLSRSTRISTNDVVGSLVSELAGGLGVSHFEVHRSPTKKRVWVLEPGDPPVLILGEDLLDDLEETAIEFLLLRYLKLVQTGLVVPAKIPVDETAMLVAAVIRQYVSDYDILGIDPKLLLERTKLVGKVIPRRSRDELMPYAYECSNANLDFSQVRQAVMQGVDRAALLGTGHVQSAVQALAAIQGVRLEGPAEARISALRPADEIQDLLRFAVSEDAFSLVAQLGGGRI